MARVIGDTNFIRVSETAKETARTPSEEPTPLTYFFPLLGLKICASFPIRGYLIGILDLKRKVCGNLCDSEISNFLRSPPNSPTQVPFSFLWGGSSVFKDIAGDLKEIYFRDFGSNKLADLRDLIPETILTNPA